ncbi:MAG: transaldolase [Gemmatimonadales bacterium]|nr:transaldolase [Gemmatimonadales bacterium]
MARTSLSGGRISTLERMGQSIWLDYIHRAMLRSGELKRLIEDFGVRGVTSNPTIFEQAIGGSDAYDDAIAQLAAAGNNVQAIYEAVAMEDIRTAADLFRPIFDMSGGNDGFVSMEVSPRLAHDTAATIAEARRLWAALGRPNVLIKIPGTVEGLPAITQAIAEGISVNVTLLFSVEMYERVIAAYLTGLEQRVAGGKPIEGIRSVASFFVSRVDTEADKRLEARIAAGADRARCEALLGTAAVANAKLAYQSYVTRFEEQRFRSLMALGAGVQRPLWASTGTKNPRYADTKYVDELVGPDTVNTMPPATLKAFADHGQVARTLDVDVDVSRARLAELEAAGVALRDLTDFLVADGVKKFADSFTSLLAAVEAKRERLAAAARI